MEYEYTEETAELFAKLEGNISVEEWRQYEQYENFVINNTDDDSDYSEGSISQDSYEEITLNVNLMKEEDGSDESDEESYQNSWECNAADKYAQGKISFVELNSILEDGTSEIHTKKRKKLEKKDGCCSRLEKEDNMEPQMKKRKTRMKRNVLPKRLGCLMGQANSHYANGDYEAAITICMELIKFAPHSYEPFQLLGVIYEEKGESRKAFQCNLVAAYLNSSDTDGWLRLAEISIERKEIHQAIKCYTKAIHNEPSNVGFLWERCNLYEQVGDRTRALYGYERILKNFCNPEDSVKCIEMARGISKIHHENGDCVNAAKVLDTAFSKFPSLVTSKDINYLLQLQLSQRMYKAAVKTFVQYCGVKLNMPSGNLLTTDSLNDADEESFKTLNSCIIPEELDLALTVKFLICLIHLKAFNAAQPLMDCLKQENPEKTGYFYLDVADALIEVQEYQEAKSFLFLLISTQSYNLPTVWMKYADCLHVLSNVQEAIQAYHKVLDLAPDVQQARLTLSKIFLAMGRRKEATDILKQKSEDGEFGITVGIDALYERCKLLEAQESWEEYISAASLLQYSHCYYLETEEEFNAAVSSQSFKNRKEILKDLKRQSKKSKPKFTGNQIPVSEMWSIFRKVLDKLMERKRYEDLQNLLLASLSSTMFMKLPRYAKDLEFQALLGCYFNGSHKYTYLFIRELVSKNLNKNKAWNLYSLIASCSPENRQNRFCMRLMLKNHNHLALGYINGHNAMMSGTYKHALGEYMCIFKEHPTDPFAAFCVGIVFVHMASQKYAVNRHSLTIQGFDFLMKYLNMKGGNQETFYNIGRALHQLGIKEAAIHYYKKALANPSLMKGSDEATFDLRREIAYNLCLIYQASGAMDVVHMYSRKYIIV